MMTNEGKLPCLKKKSNIWNKKCLDKEGKI